ncbi:MAG: hemerythrin domain-containing protein [Fidelibacterota bacterium]
MKRFPELRQLSEDHHHGLVLARRARQADRNLESIRMIWQEVAEKFRLELEPHFHIEEQFLAPPLVALGETKLTRRFNREHRQLRKLVKNQNEWSLATLLQFGELLEKHIRFEERELFETAQKRLSVDDLKTIEQAGRNLKK